MFSFFFFCSRIKQKHAGKRPELCVKQNRSKKRRKLFRAIAFRFCVCLSPITTNQRVHYRKEIIFFSLFSPISHSFSTGILHYFNYIVFRQRSYHVLEHVWKDLRIIIIFTENNHGFGCVATYIFLDIN